MVLLDLFDPRSEDLGRRRSGRAREELYRRVYEDLRRFELPAEQSTEVTKRFSEIRFYDTR